MHNGETASFYPERYRLIFFMKGTPMFIARSVASGMFRFEEHASNFPKMPLLSDDARKVYVDAYEEQVYNSYNDLDGYAHGSKLPILTRNARPVQKSFCHRPDHDVESIFWVLLVTLLRAQPRTHTENVDMTTYWKAYDLFLAHTVQTADEIDSREPLLSVREDYLEHALDPGLRSLAPMLYDMASQIRPEYAYLDPPPVPEHLHEPMRRLLLEQILKMKDDPIPLEAGSVRPLKPRDPPAQAPTVQAVAESKKPSMKRKELAEENAQAEPEGSKSKKAKRPGGYGDEDSRPRYL